MGCMSLSNHIFRLGQKKYIQGFVSEASSHIIFGLCSTLSGLVALQRSSVSFIN